MTVGSELRRAREAAGLSAEQISERTKIQLYKIEALENDDFEKLPQGIYLDGIVRAYAHEVAIDVEPMVERVRVQRGRLPGDWEVPFDADIDLHGPASLTDAATADDTPVLDSTAVDDPLSGFATEKDLRASAISKEAARPVPGPNAVHMPTTPDDRSRRPGLVLPVLVLVGALGLGFYFYQRGRENQEPMPYSENAVTPEPPAQTYAAPTQPPQQPSVETPAPPPVTPSPSLAAPAAPAPIESPPSADVTGSWRVATHVESSSLARYEGLKLGYEMQLEQQGDRIRGRGRKITENGAGVRAGAQTPLTVTGTIDGDRLTLNFVEKGTRRPTQGKFVLLVDNSGILRGRFSSSAARSSGRVEAHRVTTQ